MASIKTAAEICELIQRANNDIDALIIKGVPDDDSRIKALEDKIEWLNNLTPADAIEVDFGTNPDEPVFF